MQKEAHFHRRNLPHIYIDNSTYFITFRLKGSIPQIQLEELVAWKENLKQVQNKSEKYRQDLIFFGKYDKLLHNNKNVQYLKNPQIAKVVAAQLHLHEKRILINLLFYNA